MKLFLAQKGRRQSVPRILRGALVVSLFLISSTAYANPSATNLVTVPPVDNHTQLDAKRLFALGMIETGNDDREVGAAGEVSRFQIHPAVWKVYSKSVDYRNTKVSIEVAQQHWTQLALYFTAKAGRAPTDFDMYVLWNTRFGYYAHRGFSVGRLSAVVKDRAERFVNLVNRKG